MEKYICAIIISFYIYGFAGWIWESFLMPIIGHYKIKNRGFLNGPIIPIYGVGAVIVFLLFSANESYLSIFIEGGFVACVIEYITSWGMETLYHRRWWDYSDRAFNVNGRVCLEGFIAFGIFSIACVKYVQPYLFNKLLKYELIPLVIVATASSTIFIGDLLTTIIALAHLDERLDEIIELIEEYNEKMRLDMEERQKDFSELLETIRQENGIHYQKYIQHTGYSDRHIFNAFPNIIDNQHRDKVKDNEENK
ncbi:MAG: putative ABC transporter permease [Erysipelotrichaceae bacterium]|nr:putative ABC transporter permease [Erysipelotrichaceae bacterium]